MRDSDQEYPLHQPAQRNVHLYQTDDDEPTEVSAEKELPLRHRSPPPVQQYEEKNTPTLSGNRIKNAVIGGIIAGVLCVIQDILITVANASVFNAITPNISYDLALHILSLRALVSVISLLIYLIAGFIIGRVVVQRRLAFLAGFVAGVITYGSGLILNYIPSYPGNSGVSSTGATGNVGGVIGAIVILLIFFVVVVTIAGLLSLLGAWFATRRHPYYVGY